MNFTEARAYEEETKTYGWVFGLTSIQELMHRLGDAQEELSIIHVAGTNGKGSVCCMLANILQNAGYKTGRFQSPAVFDPLEIWSVDGKRISETEYACCMTRVKEACESMVTDGFSHPTTFEIQTALAFLYFQEQKCDRVILETGLGGKTDATNIISRPLLSIITGISMDHMNILGDSIEAIAEAKAGIMKFRSLTVSADQCPEVKKVLNRQRAILQQEEIVYVKNSDISYKVKTESDGKKKLVVSHRIFQGKSVTLSLLGCYQAKNAVLAATAANILHIPVDAICKGLEETTWPGRFEQISDSPEVYVDGAHNEAAALELEQSIKTYFPGEKLIFIMGVLADKEYHRILEHLLPYAAKVYVTEPDNPRKLPAEQLKKIIQIKGAEAIHASSQTVHLALTEAEREKRPVLVFGSLYAIEDTAKQIYLYQMKKYMFSGDFGVEKETLRVTESGYLAQSDHPEVPFVGNGTISRDFGESQMEFISGVYPSIMDAANEICRMEDAAKKALVTTKGREKEYLWPYSNPPKIHGAKDVRIAEFHGEQEEKTYYRKYLAEKYGKAKMLYSGVHFNYSFSKEMVTLCAKILHKEEREIKDGLYLKLADQLMEDSWLIVTLTAASPLCDPSFLEAMGIREEEGTKYQSFRSSIYGYWNDFTPILDYTSLEAYCKSMETYVKEGKISSVQELYYPIRLKPNGDNTMENIRKQGIGHMELRMLDLNPLCCAGVQPMDYAFLEMLCAYRLMNPMPLDEKMGDERRIRLHKEAARVDFFERYPEKMEYAKQLILDMGIYFKQLIDSYPSDIQKDYEVSIILEFEWKKLVYPQRRYANQIRKKYQNHYVEQMLEDIKNRQDM